MFENIINFFKRAGKKEEKRETQENSKDAAKERLHLVLMQDRANVSADFLELMKQEIIDVIKKYIDVDEKEIDVRLTNQENEDGTNGAPALYANIPILNIKNEARKVKKEDTKTEEKIQKEDAEEKDKEEVGTKESEEEKDKKDSEIKEDKKENDKEEKENKNEENNEEVKEETKENKEEKVKSENKKEKEMI